MRYVLGAVIAVVVVAVLRAIWKGTLFLQAALPVPERTARRIVTDLLGIVLPQVS
ncbi:hypothetical protein [Paractinoplanes lichenicola]|uniref:Uncharacterized protein n=1 Tax=Paractinoplanes lichenicola TaxID=2802976 RepID=A0ABS1VFF9_9ACTN|nr:hypothetical protein [Actinoplanes lichenicola]MBL7253355.1 hypothetical protein [Actinoplanes lichenicola]